MLNSKRPKFDPLMLEKRIDSKSKYFDKKLNMFDIFDILNQGSKNIVLIIGDSHARMIGSRFM